MLSFEFFRIIIEDKGFVDEAEDQKSKVLVEVVIELLIFGLVLVIGLKLQNILLDPERAEIDGPICLFQGLLPKFERKEN